MSFYFRYQWPGSNRHSVRNVILSHARLPIPPHWHIKYDNLEAATGFEPVIKVLQTSALPLGYAAILIKSWSGRRDSNPRPPPWQGGVLPLNYFRGNGWATRIRT